MSPGSGGCTAGPGLISLCWGPFARNTAKMPERRYYLLSTWPRIGSAGAEELS
jgi:hypothetical protein